MKQLFQKFTFGVVTLALAVSGAFALGEEGDGSIGGARTLWGIISESPPTIAPNDDIDTVDFTGKTVIGVTASESVFWEEDDATTMSTKSPYAKVVIPELEITTTVEGGTVLPDCDGVGDKLLYDDTGKVFSCGSTIPSIKSIAFGDSPYTVLTTDDVLFVDTTGGVVVVNLLPIAGNTGKKVEIYKSTEPNHVNVETNAAETIEGRSLDTIFSQFESKDYLASSTEWTISNHHKQIKGSGTGVIDGCVKTVDGGGTTYSVSAGLVQFEDHFTDPRNPKTYIKFFPGVSGRSLPNIATQNQSFVFLIDDGSDDRNLAVPASIEDTSASSVTHDNLRDKINLGGLGHPDNVNITIFTNEQNVVYDSPQRIYDIWLALGFRIMEKGIHYSPNVADNLTVNRSGGIIAGPGVNYPDFKNPDVDENVPQDLIVTMLPAYFDAPSSLVVTAPTVNTPLTQWQDGFTLVSTNPNKFYVGRYSYSPDSDLTTYRYPNAEYNSFNDAKTAIIEGTDPFVTDPSTDRVLKVRTALIFKDGTTQLVTAVAAGDAQFFDFGPFGTQVSGSGSSSTTTLQEGYNNSTQPQMTTTAGLGAVQFKRGSALDTDAVFDILSGSDVVTMSVDGNGDMTMQSVDVSETVVFSTEFDIGNSGVGFTWDFNDGQKQKVTLTDNTTATLTAPASGVGNFLLHIIQDGIGGKTLLLPVAVKWRSGTVPSFSTAANAEDFVSCYYSGVDYYCSEALDFS